MGRGGHFSWHSLGVRKVTEHLELCVISSVGVQLRDEVEKGEYRPEDQVMEILWSMLSSLYFASSYGGSLK